MTVRLLVTGTALLLAACKSGPGTVNLDTSAKYFLANGGLSLVGTSARPLGRPCLRPLSMTNTLLGGVFGASPDLVKFVEQRHLAQVARSDQPSGYEKIVLTPVAPYEKNWIGGGEFKSFCFGTATLVKVESVQDAQPITAGDSETYLISGTQARAARLTFRLTGVPENGFTEALKRRPGWLATGSMLPEDYGKDITVLATLPLDPKNFNTTP